MITKHTEPTAAERAAAAKERLQELEGEAEGLRAEHARAVEGINRAWADYTRGACPKPSEDAQRAVADLRARLESHGQAVEAARAAVQEVAATERAGHAETLRAELVEIAQEGRAALDRYFECCEEARAALREAVALHRRHVAQREVFEKAYCSGHGLDFRAGQGQLAWHDGGGWHDFDLPKTLQRGGELVAPPHNQL